MEVDWELRVLLVFPGKERIWLHITDTYAVSIRVSVHASAFACDEEPVPA